MYEKKKAEDEERKRYIEEMVTEFSRRQLNEIASGLGLNPNDYLNKREVAEAILEARDRKKAQIEEAIPGYTPVEEVTKEVEKVSTDTVRGKIKAMEKKAAEIHAFAPVFQQSVQEQMKENMAAAAKIHAFGPVFQQSVQEQVKENEAAVTTFISGVKEQMKENKNFVKKFYG